MISADKGTVYVKGSLEEVLFDLTAIVATLRAQRIPENVIWESVEEGLSGTVKSHNKEVMDMLNYILEKRNEKQKK